MSLDGVVNGKIMLKITIEKIFGRTYVGATKTSPPHTIPSIPLNNAHRFDFFGCSTTCTHNASFLLFLLFYHNRSPHRRKSPTKNTYATGRKCLKFFILLQQSLGFLQEHSLVRLLLGMPCALDMAKQNTLHILHSSSQSH